jgi:[ribosomal protein S5]-alanine N-acetyltransferase
MLVTNFDPFPLILTPRLTLRLMTEADAPQVFQLRSDDIGNKFLDRPKMENIEKAFELIQSVEQMRIAGTAINWAICLRDDPTLIGTIGFWRMQPEHYRAEIGYMLMPKHHRKGFMQEAIQPVMNFGFRTIGLHSIEAQVNPFNEASIKILERNRFVREGYFRENYFFDGKFLDTGVYSCITDVPMS